MSELGQTRKCPRLHGTSVVPWIVLQESIWGNERKFLDPLMRFVRGDIGTTSFHTKTTTELRIGATGYCRGGVG